MYRPPQSDNDINIKINRTIESTNSINNNLIIMGDFNYPDINWSTNNCNSQASEQFVDTIHNMFLSQIVEQPTRGNTILDLILTSDTNMTHDIDVGEPLVSSDHNCIRFLLNVNFENSNRPKSFLDFSKAEFEGFNTELSYINWDGVLGG